MKRIPRDPEKHEVLTLFDSIGKKKNLKLQDKNSEKAFLDSVTTSLARNKDTPILLHGHRIEAMFGFILGSLGECLLIKQEDAGETYSAITEIQPPDYRIILNNGEELFIEVKNCHKIDSSYQIKKTYIDALRKYADIFKKDLKIAIYWSKWNMWTLISHSQLEIVGKKYCISFPKAIKVNEMAIIGDRSIGTTPPLILRFGTDKKKPRSINDEGNVAFTIGSVELKCGGNIIKSKFEKNLAFMFMIYGRWPSSEPRAIIENNKLLAIEFTSEPEEYDDIQGFSIIGSLSDMIAQRYNELTTTDGEVVRLSPSVEPGTLGINIPKDFKGENLPLWQLILQPNYGEIDS